MRRYPDSPVRAPAAERTYAALLDTITRALLRSRLGPLADSANDQTIEQAVKDADAVIQALAADPTDS